MPAAAGTYMVINANSLLALDVCGASDLSGANVQQWDPNGGDAQVWALVAGDGGWALTCSLTGKVLDVAGGRMADGTNVRQWDGNGSAAQRWDLAADGKTLSYKGKAYDTYAILSAKDNGFALDVSAGGKAAGTNVQVWTANGSDAQRWALVPVACMVSGGTYAIHSALADDLVLDVAGASTGGGANVQLWSANGTNAQVWQAVVDPGALLVTFVRPDCGMALDVAGGEDRDGANVQQWGRNGSAAQSWLPVPSGTVEVNGAEVPAYAVRSRSGSGRCLDVAAGGRAPATNVQIWGANGSDAQRFWFEHASLTSSSVPAPVVLGLVAPSGTARTVTARGDVSVRVRVTSQAPAVKARYRLVERAWGRRPAQSVGPWRSLADGSTANGGWGDGWAPTASGYGQLTLPAEVACRIGEGSNDRVDVQVEAYGLAASTGALGATARSATATATLVVAWEPRPAVASASVTADGVALTLTSDAPTSGNVYAAEALGGSASSAPARGSATVTVPWSGLGSMPRDGEEVPVRVTVATPDATATATLSARVSWAAGSAPDVERLEDDASRRLAVLRSSAAVRSALVAWAEAGRMRFERCLARGGVVTVPYPMGRGEWYVVVTTASGARTVSYGDQGGDALVWVWGKAWEGWCAIACGSGSAPSVGRRTSYSTTSAAANGREHPMVRAWPTREESLPVEGAVPAAGEPAPAGCSGSSAVDALRLTLGEATYPIFRAPSGVWERVAVTEVEQRPLGGGAWEAVSVTQQAVSDGE